MIKLCAASAAVLLTTSAVMAEDLPMNMTTGALASTCSFSNPVTGAITYNEASDTFQAAGGTPSTIDIFYRNMSTVSVVSTGALGAQSDAFDAMDYTAGTSTLGAAAVLNVGVATNLAGEVTLVDTAELTETLTILPDAAVKDSVSVEQNTSYAAVFTVTCVE